MGSENPVATALFEQRQMGVGAEGAVAHKDVAGGQRLVCDRGMGHVVGPHFRGDGLVQRAVVGVEQSEQMGHGKAASGRLAARLSERFLQLGRVGH